MINKKIIILIFLSVILISNQLIATTKHPDCKGSNRYPANVSYVHLKNLKLITPEEYAKSKIIVERLASEKINTNLFNQVHHITFILESGKTLEAITKNDVSFEECSISGVKFYLLSPSTKK